MATKTVLQRPQNAPELSKAKPLSQFELAWQAWVAKGRAQDIRGSLRRMDALKWVSVAGLLITAELWSVVAPYEAVVKLLVAASAMVVMLEAFRARNFVLSAAFGALVLLHNPIVPVFRLSGDWQRIFMAASALPFVVSLALRKAKPVRP